MELYLLGTGTCAPDPRRAPCCYYLAMGPTKIIIDPGPGAVSRIIAAGLDPYDADAVFLSHHHPDHCSDLVFYLFSMKNCLEEPSRDAVKIVAPEGFGKAFDGLMDVFGQWVMTDKYDIVIDEVREDAWEGPGYRVRSAPMLHGANAVGFRFESEGGRALAYSGDTGYCEELIGLAEGADALLVECSVPDDQPAEGHMSPSEVAQTGVRSGVPRLILTHFYPVVDTGAVAGAVRAAGYEGEIVVGEDGMKLTL